LEAVKKLQKLQKLALFITFRCHEGTVTLWRAHLVVKVGWRSYFFKTECVHEKWWKMVVLFLSKKDLVEVLGVTHLWFRYYDLFCAIQ